MLREQIERNEKEYEAPHPESAKVVPASEGMTEHARAQSQQTRDVKVEGEVRDKDLIKVEKTLGKVHIGEDLPNGAVESLNH